MEGVKQQGRSHPFLRWAGSKRQLLGTLEEYWHRGFERYVEPFAGSASFFFRLSPAKALLSDKNSELVEVYRVMRRCPVRLHRLVSSFGQGKDAYYAIRGVNSRRMSALRRAARFIYLNRFCFNGLYRTNRRGDFNVPYAPTGTGDIPSLQDFETCADLLQSAQLRNWDFGTTLRYVRRGDFVYLDPPFAVSSRRVFVEYGPKLFDTNDLERLARHLDKIDSRGASFLLSYADCREARQAFAGWSTRRVRVRRNIAGFAGHRRTAYELLVTNRD